MITVVRHGQTDWNKEGRLQGRQGLPLNRAGRMQAESLRAKLASVHWDYVFASPQERASQTAEIATGLKPIIDARLDVFDLGQADGMHRSEVILSGHVPDPGRYEGVEDIQAFIGRVFDFMRELEARHGESEDNILIAGHRCTTGCIGAYFMGIPEDGNILKYASANGSFNTYRFSSNPS
ncbi:histidine phosphatase family protein [Paenibacillus lycopersici]|uniref:Histidine phosphatase family protein n=1 Tax=Paenibacillus lycopersici TaxID=2704462 RepID=A0A6C0FTV5_9BACL|nr:histidine phosphatase family protein [Paenibacillus lycopersici]QHT60588.1 histidine phosphatase family protein [Paenibacillus lycopersici]